MTQSRRSIRILRRAERDLDEIHRYIRSDSPDAADRLTSQLLDAIESLELSPERGPRPQDDRLRRLGYRVLIHAEYLIFYKVLPRQVRIYRVLHGRRRYAHLL